MAVEPRLDSCERGNLLKCRCSLLAEVAARQAAGGGGRMWARPSQSRRPHTSYPPAKTVRHEMARSNCQSHSPSPVLSAGGSTFGRTRTDGFLVLWPVVPPPPTSLSFPSCSSSSLLRLQHPTCPSTEAQTPSPLSHQTLSTPLLLPPASHPPPNRWTTSPPSARPRPPSLPPPHPPLTASANAPARPRRRRRSRKRRST